MQSNVGALTIRKSAVLTFVLLVGVAVAAPVIFNQQLITGTIVNATLIVGVCQLGVPGALVIGLLPSSIALATGLLPAVMAPMIPFIIVGNTILVVTFNYLRNINYWLGITAGAILKFAFLFGICNVVVGMVINEQVSAKISGMMSWPQLVTALCGGILAFGVVKLWGKIRG
jgi:hypothetical protein